MLKKFAMCDDGVIRVIPKPTPQEDAQDAGRQLGTDVLFTLDINAINKLRKNVDEVLAFNANQEALAHLKTLPLVDAQWWFIENVAEDSIARTECFFELRSRRSREAR